MDYVDSIYELPGNLVYHIEKGFDSFSCIHYNLYYGSVIK